MNREGHRDLAEMHPLRGMCRKVERDKIHNDSPSINSHPPWHGLISGLYAAQGTTNTEIRAILRRGNTGGFPAEIEGTSEGRYYSHSLNFVS